jgi:hypothetical protein
MLACRHILISASACLAVLLSINGQLFAQANDNQANVEQLTRGPIHEAFAEPIQLNPQAGPIISREPPPPIEEIPPDEKPDGDNVVWIPGYWQWDDANNDFVWVSGVWRNVPPNETWVPGYWDKVSGGYQWVSGLWDKTGEDIQYLPEPPASLENGPTTEAVNNSQIWVPGCWVWVQNRYMWRPGFWMTANPNWVWIPAHYEWSPSGYVFIDGYWDYPLLNRGLVFAPIAFRGGVRARYIYTPRVVLDLAALTTSLFINAKYDHYYFGDYYANNYFRNGYYPWFAFHGSRYGYDPLFAHWDWRERQHNPNWERQLRELYVRRRDHDNDRPPHTWNEFERWTRTHQNAPRTERELVHRLDEAAKNRDFSTHLRHVEQNDLNQFKNHVQQDHRMRENRQKWEREIHRQAPRPNVTPKPGTTRPPETIKQPARVKAPQSEMFKPTSRSATNAIPHLPTQPQAIQHSPGTVRPQIVLPHPEQMMRPDFDRGHHGRQNNKDGGKGNDKDHGKGK